MLYIYITITLILLTVAQFCFIISFRKPIVMARFLSMKVTNRLPLYIFSATTLFLFFILYLFLKDLSSPQPKDTSFSIDTFTMQKEGKRDIQELRVETYPNIQNLYFIYSGSDKTEITLQNIATDLRKADCTLRCTINLYDNKEAYTLDRERVSISDSNKMTQWNVAHYIFVADHYLGYLSNEQYPAFSYYPYRDKYYDKLKTK